MNLLAIHLFSVLNKCLLPPGFTSGSNSRRLGESWRNGVEKCSIHLSRKANAPT